MMTVRAKVKETSSHQHVGVLNRHASCSHPLQAEEDLHQRR